MARGMNKLLKDFKAGRISLGDALSVLKDLPYKDLGFAKIDNHRGLRRGFPEVIFGEGKTAGQILEIARRIVAHEGILLITHTPKRHLFIT